MSDKLQSVVNPDDYVVVIVENNKANRELLEITAQFYLLNVVGSFLNQRDFLAYISNPEIRRQSEFSDKQFLIIADQHLDDGKSLDVLDDPRYQEIGRDDMWLVYSTDDTTLRKRIKNAEDKGVNIAIIKKPITIQEIPGKINSLREKKEAKK